MLKRLTEASWGSDHEPNSVATTEWTLFLFQDPWVVAIELSVGVTIKKPFFFCESGSLVVLGPLGGWVTIEDLKSERRGGYCTKDESKSYPRPKQANSPKMTTFQRK